jgi:hypothetical protein
MIEQCQVGERPKCNESGPVDENGADGDPRTRLPGWPACGPADVLPFA